MHVQNRTEEESKWQRRRLAPVNGRRKTSTSLPAASKAAVIATRRRWPNATIASPSLDEWANPQLRQKEVAKKRRKAKGRIMFPTSHDITPQFLDHCVTVLRKLLAAGNEVLIVTKPHLDCIERLCRELAEYREKIVFRFTIGAMDDELLRFWEPGAPALPSGWQRSSMPTGKAFRRASAPSPCWTCRTPLSCTKRWCRSSPIPSGSAR